MHRRNFLKLSAMAAISSSLIGVKPVMAKKNNNFEFKTNNPQNILIAWYSPTENTERYAKFSAQYLNNQGLNAHAYEYRAVDLNTLAGYDLIIVAAPVYNWQIPNNVLVWLEALPKLTNIPVASFVSFGGPEGNQHNSVCSILEILSQKDAIPVGLDSFMNISSYPTPDWDSRGQIEHKDLPNAQSYAQVQTFLNSCLENIRQAKALNFSTNFAWRDLLTVLPITKISKYAISEHIISKGMCVQCGICVANCPAKAIDLKTESIDREKCILCFSCFNRCPSQAIQMTSNKRKLYNYAEFKRRNNIQDFDYTRAIPLGIANNIL